MNLALVLWPEYFTHICDDLSCRHQRAGLPTCAGCGLRINGVIDSMGAPETIAAVLEFLTSEVGYYFGTRFSASLVPIIS